MTRLILTTNASSAGDLMTAGRADIAIDLVPRFVWGPLSSDAELAAILAPRTTQKPGSHWLDYASSKRMKEFGGRDFGLIEFFQRCEAVELWMETEPNAQLVLIWLLDYLHSHADAAMAQWRLPAVKILNDHLETASAAWQAYRQPKPQDWFNLLDKDLSVLSQLRQTVLELLEELPTNATGPWRDGNADAGADIGR